MPRKSDNESGAIEEFLNPASMVTPGVAGSLTMIITNALSLQFGFTASWTGLVVSFLCGTLVFVSSVGLAKKLVFYVLNSLIIFSVAAGTTGFAASATQRADWNLGLSPAHAAAPEPAEARQIAQAQPADDPASAIKPPAGLATELPAETFEPETSGASQAALEEQIKALKLQLQDVEDALAEAEAQAELARTEAEAAKLEAVEAIRRTDEDLARPAEAVKDSGQSTQKFFRQWF